MFHATTRRSAGALIALAIMASSAIGATFRVTTRIYLGAELDPSAEHDILFDNGLVYDLPQIEQRFVTVFDPAQNRVTLLDRKTQVQTTIKTGDLLKAAAQLRAAAEEKQQQARVGLSAVVQPSQRVIGYTIQFGDFEYHTTTQTPEDGSIATDYGRYALLTARLNIIRQLGPPPFGRMTLNQHIAGKGELPLETTLTLGKGNSAQEFRSEHVLGKLTADDQAAIDEVRGMLTLYREVKLREFPADDS